MGFPEQEEQTSDLNIEDLLMHLDVSLTCSCCFSPLLDVTDEMLSFFLTLFQGLRVQMGVPFTEQIIQTFLNMFTRYCPTLVTSSIPLRMVYLRSCSASWSLSLKWAVCSLCDFCHIPGLNLRKTLPSVERPSACPSVTAATVQSQLSHRLAGCVGC